MWRDETQTRHNICNVNRTKRQPRFRPGFHEEQSQQWLIVCDGKREKLSRRRARQPRHGWRNQRRQPRLTQKQKRHKFSRYHDGSLFVAVAQLAYKPGSRRKNVPPKTRRNGVVGSDSPSCRKVVPGQTVPRKGGTLHTFIVVTWLTTNSDLSWQPYYPSSLSITSLFTTNGGEAVSLILQL